MGFGSFSHHIAVAEASTAVMNSHYSGKLGGPGPEIESSLIFRPRINWPLGIFTSVSKMSSILTEKM